jgi:hypothetical protein
VSRHPHAVAHDPAPSWFAVAVPATLAYAVAASAVWSSTGLVWAGIVVGLLLVAVTALVARHRSADRFVGYVAGSAVTLLGLYAALTFAAEFWVGSVGG